MLSCRVNRRILCACLATFPLKGERLQRATTLLIPDLHRLTYEVSLDHLLLFLQKHQKNSVYEIQVDKFVNQLELLQTQAGELSDRAPMDVLRTRG